MTIAELFAGIGGWSEAARMCGGIHPVWVSEIDKYKNLVYALRHPNTPNLGDIRNIPNQCPHADIYTVSFPCTGISVAGSGAGLENEHSKLWFEAERLIGANRPKYVVVENGPILTKRGLARILAGLAAHGYDAEWTPLQGNWFGVQQLRKRLFVVAYPSENGRQGKREQANGVFRQWKAEKPFAHILPGWATRRDIPKPLAYRSANDFPNLIHRLECTGDAIIPLIGCYVLRCVQLHHQSI